MKATILFISVFLFACQKQDVKVARSGHTLIVSAGYVKAMKGKPSGPPGKNKPQPTDTTTPPPTDTVVIPPPTPETGYSLTTTAITSQSPELSCVAHAITNAMSIDRYYKAGEMLQFSTEFLYNQTKFGADCGSGSNASYALDFVKANGVCRKSVMPDADGCSLMPTDAQRADAANYRIGEYYFVTNSDRDAIKALLQQHRAVITTILVNSDFLNAKAGYVWNPTVRSGLGHNLIIVGYDDAKGWKLMNSYGTSWGDAGYLYVTYDGYEIVSNTWCQVL